MEAGGRVDLQEMLKDSMVCDQGFAVCGKGFVVRGPGFRATP